MEGGVLMADKILKRLLTRKEACDYVGLGLTRGTKFCNEAGARIQIGNRAMFDREKLDQFINKQTETAGK